MLDHQLHVLRPERVTYIHEKRDNRSIQMFSGWFTQRFVVKLFLCFKHDFDQHVTEVLVFQNFKLYFFYCQQLNTVAGKPVIEMSSTVVEGAKKMF